MNSNKERNEKCAQKIIQWLKTNNLDEDVCILFNNRRIDVKTGLNEQINTAGDWVDYYNDNTITMTFEGPLYDLLNGYFDSKKDENLYDQFNVLLKEYNYYFELGNDWNLTLYDL